MSEAFWVALLGIAGTIIASIVPLQIQRNYEKTRYLTELYAKYKIENLQRHQIAIVECQHAYITAGLPIRSAEHARQFLIEVKPHRDELFRAQMVTRVYFQNDPHALETISTSFRVLSNIYYMAEDIEQMTRLDPHIVNEMELNCDQLGLTTNEALILVTTALAPTTLNNVVKK